MLYAPKFIHVLEAPEIKETSRVPERDVLVIRLSFLLKH